MILSKGDKRAPEWCKRHLGCASGPRSTNDPAPESCLLDDLTLDDDNYWP